MDPDTGAAGYLISGGTAGGKTSLLQLIGQKLKDTTLSAVVFLVEARCRLYVPGQDDIYYEAVSEGFVRGYIGGFAGAVKAEWNNIKDLPKMVKAALKFAGDYITKDEFRDKVKDDLENLVKMLPEVWSKIDEITQSIYEYYLNEVEDVAYGALGLARADRYFQEFAICYSGGKIAGFITVTVAGAIIGAKVVAIIKDFIMASKLGVIFKILQVAKGSAIKYVVDVFNKASSSVKSVFFNVLDKIKAEINDASLLRLVPKYFSEGMDEIEDTIRRYGDEAAEKIAESIIYIKQLIGNLNIKNAIEKSADDANDWWRIMQGYDKPPYKPGTRVIEFELENNHTFVRVYDDINSSMKGQWIMKEEDILGLSPAQIRQKFALPAEPKYIVDVELDAGTNLRCGIANGVEDWGVQGGGVQFDLMGQFVNGFKNPRPLN